MHAIWNLARKDLRLLWRDKPGLFWVLIFPVLMALFFGSMFGGMGEDKPHSVQIGIISEPGSVIAGQIYALLDSSDVIETVPMTLDSARHAVQRGALVGYVDVRTQAQSSFQLFAESTVVDVGIDPARQMEAGLLQGLVNQAYYQNLQRGMMNSAGMDTALLGWRTRLDSLSATSGSTGRHVHEWTRFLNGLDTMMKARASLQQADSGTGTSTSAGFGNLKVRVTKLADERVGPRSGFEITFPQAIQWALIGTAAAFGVGIVIERTRGTWLRLRLSPLSRAQILAGKGVACFVACISVSTLLMTLGVVIFHVHIADPGMLAAAIVASSLCFVGLMMLMSVLGKTENSVSSAGWAMFMVSSMLGGGMIPLMFLPTWIEPVSNLSPVKWSILALEGAIWRGFGWSEMALPLAVLCGIGVVGYLVGVRVLSRAD